MNGEQKTDMKDIRTETRDTVPDPFKPLSSPHFDEFAVAAARQVQPLPPRRNRRFFRSSLLLIAYLEFIVATVGVAYLSPPSSRAEVSNETISSETQSDTQPALDGTAPGMPGGESMATPAIRRPRRHSRRVSRFRVQNQNIEIVEGDESKLVPRKVSELRYGRSSDRP
jgi:hypothetical protein